MTFFLHTRYLPTALVLLLVLTACDSNDDGDSEKEPLLGSYEVHSITDKSGDMFGQAGLTIVSGTPATVDDASVDFTGTYQLSQNQYEWEIEVTEDTPLGGSTGFTESETGQWSVSGNQVTFTNLFNDPPDRTMSFTLNGDRLTIEDGAIRIIMDR